MATLRRISPREAKGNSLGPIDDKTRAQAAAIVAEVREGGEQGLLRVATKFGDLAEGTQGPTGWFKLPQAPPHSYLLPFL